MDIRDALTDKHFELPASDLVRTVHDARDRTLAVVADLHDEQLEVPLGFTVNPFRWELGHVAFFYEVFLLRPLDGADFEFGNAADLYDSFNVEHDHRWALSLPSRNETLEYMGKVLEKVTGRIEGREPTAQETYLYLLAVLHEDMHGEAFTYMRQTLGYAPPPVAGTQARPVGGPLAGDVEIPGGNIQLGAVPDDSFVYDNEKWAHAREVAPFEMARAPVTNAEFSQFVDDGGYLKRDLWSYQGWLWRTRTGAMNPVYWSRGEKSWLRRHYDRVVPLMDNTPVTHVTWFEAEAYCAWAGRRLPTEAEWQMAAAAEPSADGSGVSGHGRRYPWGDEPPTAERANLDSTHLGPVDVGAFPSGDSSFGCRQMLGNVWEWTADPFYPFPGFVPDVPYKEYSAPWFGYFKVLKGGAWATRSRLACNKYRNYALPFRNDILAGFRTCAR